MDDGLGCAALSRACAAGLVCAVQDAAGRMAGAKVSKCMTRSQATAQNMEVHEHLSDDAALMHSEMRKPVCATPMEPWERGGDGFCGVEVGMCDRLL